MRTRKRFAPATDSLLAIENLAVQFQTRAGPIIAVEDASLTVSEGEIVGLVGESGSGKSVTALSVLGLLPPRSTTILRGSLLFDGRDLRRVSKRELRRLRGGEVGFIFQDPLNSLNPVMTVGDQIEETLQIHQPALTAVETRRRVTELLEEVKIPDPEIRARQYPHEFSGGMRQRVMFAMAVANRPKLLIADEPTTSLDVTVQKSILQLIEGLRTRHGTAVLLISHDLGVVGELADRVTVMYGGYTVETGAAEQVLTTPRHPYTRALLRSRPTIKLHQGPLLTIHGQPPDPGARPAGCVFAPRCTENWRDEALCAGQMPDPVEVPPNARFRCYFPLDAEPSADHIDPEDPAREPDRRPVSVDEGGARALTVSNLTVRFSSGRRAVDSRLEGIEAVKDVHLVIPEGTTLGLVGESGSGKSSLARAILNLVSRSSGEVVIAGRQLPDGSSARMGTIRRAAQMVFQDPYSSLNPRRTVGASVAEPLLIHRESTSGVEARDRASQALVRVGLQARDVDRYPYEFSGGQLQRIAIARALILNPRLVVLDEPVSSLDVSVQAQILNLLQSLQDQDGLSYLLISHDLAVVSQMAHTVAVMYLGRIVEVGPREEVMRNPAHPYTRLLLDSIPRPLGAAFEFAPSQVAASGVSIESPTLTQGCAFRGRCPRAEAICEDIEPRLEIVGSRSDHEAACHFPGVSGAKARHPRRTEDQSDRLTQSRPIEEENRNEH